MAEATKLTRKQEQGVQSRARILDAAKALIAERGYAATSISAVQKASGLPASSIYWHFESKEGLLAALMEREGEKWLGRFSNWTDLPEKDPASRLRALFDSAARAVADEPEFQRILLGLAMERAEGDAATLAAIRRVREIALATLDQMFLAFLPPGGPRKRRARDLSMLAMFCFDGALVAHRIDPEVDLRRVISRLADALCALLPAEA